MRARRLWPGLPRGWWDALRQLLLFMLAYQGYQVVRGLTEGSRDTALGNAQDVIDLERGLGLFFEPDLQSSLLDNRWVIDIANFLYVNTHFTISTAFIVWLYLYRNDFFYFVRNTMMIAMGIALVGYGAYPCAPPRMMLDAGFTDTIKSYSDVDQDSKAISLLVNKYAAVPSMHIGFSLLIGLTAYRLCRRAVPKILWSMYPVLVFFVITVTANHFWVDALAGALVAGIAAFLATQLAHAGPPAWTWPGSEEALTPGKLRC